MSEQRSIVDRMGISFLTDAPEGSSEPLGDPDGPRTDSTVNRSSRIFANWTVLSALSELGAHDHPVKMSEVAVVTRSRADILLPIEDSLIRLGWLEVVDKSAFGDDSVKLTDIGFSVVEAGEAKAVLDS